MGTARRILAGCDDRLTRLGREWFAEVRRTNPGEEGERKRRQRKGDGERETGFWDRLFGEGDAGGCAGRGD